MSKLQQTKQKVFGTISSFNTLINNFPELKNLSNLLPSINTSNNQLEYVVDLFSVLGSVDDLKNCIVEIVIHYLDDVERKIKDTLKRLIKENIACTINPSIIQDMKVNGITLPISSFDFFNLMRKSPFDKDSSSYYFDVYGTDVNSAINSKDFNAFLWYVVNCSNSSGATWKNTNNLAQLNFIESTNSITFKINNNYLGSLNDFNSAFIDSIQLFDKDQIVAQLLGKVFGTLDIGISRTQEEIFLEKQVTDIIERITNCSSNTVIDDSYFTFSDEDYQRMLRESELRKKGQFLYSNEENITVNLTNEDIKNALHVVHSNSDLVEREDVFNQAIDILIDKALENNPKTTVVDRFNFRTNIIKSLLIELSSMITLTILTPKIYLLLLVNLKMLGIDTSKFDLFSFVKENVNIVSEIATEIKDVVMDKLVEEIIKLATQLALKMSTIVIKEQTKSFGDLMSSLKPIPAINLFQLKI